MLERALEKWKTLPREERLLTSIPQGTPVVQNWQRLYPADGLVLSVVSRDLPRDPPESSPRHNAWNRDFAWFRKEESRQLVPSEIKKGAATEIPQEIVHRIVRLHMVDNVRGETQPYPLNAVERATLTSRIYEIDGDTVKLHLEGESRASLEGIWSIAGYRDMATPSPQKRSFEAKLLGKAVYDRKKERFTGFEMLAVGIRTGATQYNGRSRDPGPAPMGHAFTLAGDTPAERVPPAYFGAYAWR